MPENVDPVLAETIVDLGKSLVLLTDAIMVLERAGVSPPLQKRIAKFLKEIGDERLVDLMRIAHQPPRT